MKTESDLDTKGIADNMITVDLPNPELGGNQMCFVRIRGTAVFMGVDADAATKQAELIRAEVAAILDAVYWHGVKVGEAKRLQEAAVHREKAMDAIAYSLSILAHPATRGPLAVEKTEGLMAIQSMFCPVPPEEIDPPSAEDPSE